MSIKNKFIELIEGNLDEAERNKILSEIESDPGLKKQWEEYQELVNMEKKISDENHSLDGKFTQKVMSEIESKQKTNFFAKLGSLFQIPSRFIYAGAGGLAVIVFALNLIPYQSDVPRDRLLMDKISQKPDLMQEKEAAFKEAKAASEDLVKTVDSELIHRQAVEKTKEQKLAPAANGGEGQAASQPKVTADEKDTNNIVSELGSKNLQETMKALGQTEETKTFDKDKIVKEIAKDMRDPQEVVDRMGRLAEMQGLIDAKKNALGNQAGIAAPSEQKEEGVATLEVDGKKRDYDFSADAKQKGEEQNAPGALSPVDKMGRAVIVDGGKVVGDSVSLYGDMAEPPLPPQKVFKRSENEKYAEYQESALTSVKDQSVSTFSVDVDTASYTNMRSYLKTGQLPPANSVRVEEYLNYFNYDYPVQYEKPFNLSYEIAPSPLEPKKYLLKLGIKAKDIKESSKPWNLVFLVDVSGSMDSPDKLEMVKKSLRILLDNMRAQDKVSLVTYSGRTETVLDGSTIKEKDKILDAIDKLYAAGSTDGGSGLKDAYQIAKKNLNKEGINRIILATDGDFNVGVTSTDQLIKIVQEEAKTGVTMTTIGYGRDNINDETMEQIADKGNGNYFYVDSLEEARRVFEKKLYGTIEVVAKDVKLQVEFNPAKVSNYRLIGYDNRVLKNEDFNNDKVDAGEIGAGHTVTALYEVVLTGSEAAKELNVEHRYADNQKKVEETPNTMSELGFLKIRYKGPDSDTSELLSFPIEQSNLKEKPEQASDDFRFASAVVYFGQLLRGSKYAGSYTYKDIAKLAESSTGKDAEGQRREFVELVKNAELGK